MSRFDFTHEFRATPPCSCRQDVSKTLEGWNQYRRAWWAAKLDKFHHPEKYMNGLRCPKCDYISLYDTGQQVSFAPNVLRVKCTNPGCGYKGDRLE